MNISSETVINCLIILLEWLFLIYVYSIVFSRFRQLRGIENPRNLVLRKIRGLGCRTDISGEGLMRMTKVSLCCKSKSSAKSSIGKTNGKEKGLPEEFAQEIISNPGTDMSLIKIEEESRPR